MIVIVFFLMWWIVAWMLLRRYECTGKCSAYVYNEEKAFVVIMSNLVGLLYGIVVAGFLYLVL